MFLNDVIEEIDICFCVKRKCCFRLFKFLNSEYFIWLGHIKFLVMF